MADAIVSLVLDKLAVITEDKFREEIGLVRGVEKEVLYLSSQLTVIRDVLEDAEKRGYKEKSIQKWLKKLEDISYDMDDVLDEWNYAILKLQIEGFENVIVPKPKVCSFIPCSCLCIKKVAIRHDIAVKIKGLKERLDEIVKEKDQYKFIVDQVVDPRESKGQVVHEESDKVRSTSTFDEKDIQGREVDKDVLVNKLIHECASQESSPNVISIVGIGGVGKTTIGQLAYNDERVINYFKLRIWICVSEVFDVVRIAKGIVESVKMNSPNVHELDAVLKCVMDSITREKFLLVLDDVWTEDYNKWEPLKNSLKCGGPGSKILVTTRSERVARMMGTIEIHPLGKISDADCWSLMKRIAFSGRREEEFEQLYDTGKKIAKKCKGLPLAAKVLGSLLCFKDTLEEWENVLNSEIWQLEKIEVDLFPHFLLSYNELSSAMKRCFSYCAIFPKDYKIDVKNLIRMWMALGYLRSDRSSGDLEHKGKEYFENLRMRSFFQDFVDHGDEMSCKMHDIVHDFAQFLTKRKSHDSEDYDGKLGVREKWSCQALDSSLVSQIKVNRGLFYSKELPPNLLDSVTRLRVLSFLYHGSEEIAGNIANLIHLRYLDLRGNMLILQVLQSICKLYNLQTLYLSDCNLTEVPRELGNLIQLRHLDLSSNYVEEIPREIKNLIQLESLDLCADTLKEIPKEIGNLIRLKSLDLSSNRLKEIPREIGNLIRLENLDLGFNGLNEIPREIWNLIQLERLDLSWNSLKEIPRETGNLIKLKHMHLRSNSLTEIPREIGKLTPLKCLSLSSNNLNEIPREIGNLTRLECLDLSANSLKEIPREIGNLIWLECLDLSSNSLKEIPREIENLIQLKDLDLGLNGLNEIPREIGNLTRLECLDLRQNGLKEISRELGNLIRLKRMDLSWNGLIEIPREIGNLIQLESLHLKSNNLNNIPREMGNWIQLKDLDLSSNSLKEIPREIGNLIQLKNLDLSSNGLNEIPSEIGNLTWLDRLDLSSNGLNEIPREIGNLIQLEILDLSSNGLNEIPREIENLIWLEFLDLRSNSLNEIAVSFVSTLPGFYR